MTPERIIELSLLNRGFLEKVLGWSSDDRLSYEVGKIKNEGDREVWNACFAESDPVTPFTYEQWIDVFYKAAFPRDMCNEIDNKVQSAYAREEITNEQVNALIELQRTPHDLWVRSIRGRVDMSDEICKSLETATRNLCTALPEDMKATLQKASSFEDQIAEMMQNIQLYLKMNVLIEQSKKRGLVCG